MTSLSCNESLVIRINSAYWGQQATVDFSASGKGNNEWNVCYNRGVYSDVRNAYEGKKTCIISAPVSDPWVGFWKIYFITYYCIDNQKLNNLNNCGNTESSHPDTCLLSNYPSALKIIVVK